jgi:hypothetical protein
MIFKIFSPKFLAKKMAFLTQNKGKIVKHCDNIGFLRKTPIFGPKCAKMSKNRDHM